MSRKNISFLSFGKGVAIVSIILYHILIPIFLNKPFMKIISLGGTGAHIFIFLSGFGLCLSTYIDFKSFYKRRFLKVLLPYYFVITCICLINIKLHIYNESNQLYSYLSHILQYRMFLNKYEWSFGTHFWFISTIIQFYLIYPLLRFMLNKNPKFSLVISFVISILYWVFIYRIGVYDERIWNSSALQFLWEFMLGMYLANLFKNNGYEFWNEKLSILFLLFVVCFGINLASFFSSANFIKVFNDVPMALMYGVFCILLYRFSNRYMRILTKVFVFIGTLSYWIYLTHIFYRDLILKYYPVGKYSYFHVCVVLTLSILTSFIAIMIPRLLNALKSHIESEVTA